MLNYCFMFVMQKSKVLSRNVTRSYHVAVPLETNKSSHVGVPN